MHVTAFALLVTFSLIGHLKYSVGWTPSVVGEYPIGKDDAHLVDIGRNSTSNSSMKILPPIVFPSKLLTINSHLLLEICVFNRSDKMKVENPKFRCAELPNLSIIKHPKFFGSDKESISIGAFEKATLLDKPVLTNGSRNRGNCALIKRKTSSCSNIC